jgi:hypothetical protein
VPHAGSSSIEAQCNHPGRSGFHQREGQDSVSEPTAEDIRAAIEIVDLLDLTPISEKLQSEPGDIVWSADSIEAMERSYRKFLVLNKLYPDVTLGVNKMLDEYWHQHILDTRKYAADCETVFGRFLHHYPYFGMAGDAEMLENSETYSETQDIWERMFGETQIPMPSLSLDRVLGGGQQEDGELTSTTIYAFPAQCKNGQHCTKTITAGGLASAEA